MNPCHGYAHVYDRLIDGAQDGEARSVLYRGALTAARNICGTCPLMAACHTEHADEGWVKAIHSRLYRKPPQQKGRRQAHHDERLEELRQLDARGANLHEVLRALGMAGSGNTFHKWCSRNGHLDLYDRIAARSRLRPNQYTKAREVA